MGWKTLDDIDLKGKVVLTRVDINVPVEGGKVTDATRIERIVPTVRDRADENLTAQGAYLLRDPGERHVTLIATGSEVEIALAAADALTRDGVAVSYTHLTLPTKA